ncbi:flagellar protein FlaG [bacterium]|nr:flagellar protein FlaG [bacterium]
MNSPDNSVAVQGIKPAPVPAKPLKSPELSVDAGMKNIGEATAKLTAELSESKTSSAKKMEDLQVQLKETIESLNIKMEIKSSNLSFSIDEISDRVMVTVVNDQTGERIRQVPAEAIIKVAHNMEALKGVIFDELF